MSTIEQFKVREVGIDARNLTYSPIKPNYYDWINTSLDFNNEFEIVDFVKDNPNAKLSTITTFLDKLDVAIISHTKLLGRYYIDLLLIDTKCDNVFEYKDTIEDLLANDIIKSIGVYCNPKSTLEEIINFCDKLFTLFPTFSHIGCNICPLNFNMELIDWIDRNGLQLIGFNPFGGHITAPSIIDSFTIPFLLGFISAYSDVVMLSGSMPLKSEENLGYIKNLIGTELTPKYILTKSSEKLIEPMKKIINTSLRVCKNLTIPYDESDMLFNPAELSINLGYDVFEHKCDDKVTEEQQSTKEGKVISLVTDYLGITSKPIDGANSSFLTITKDKIYDIIDSIYKKEDGYILKASRMTNNIFVYTVIKQERKWDWVSFSKVDKLTDSHVFIYSYFGKDIKVFQEVTEDMIINKDNSAESN